MQTLADINLMVPVTIRAEESLNVAWQRLLENDAAELYVVDDEQHLQGIVPDYELLKARLSGSWSELTVAQVMSHRVVCFTRDTPFAVALKAFREGQHTRVAVLEDGRLIGQITRRLALKELCPSPSGSGTVSPPKFLQTLSAMPSF